MARLHCYAGDPRGSEVCCISWWATDSTQLRRQQSALRVLIWHFARVRATQTHTRTVSRSTALPNVAQSILNWHCFGVSNPLTAVPRTSEPLRSNGVRGTRHSAALPFRKDESRSLQIYCWWTCGAGRVAVCVKRMEQGDTHMNLLGTWAFDSRDAFHHSAAVIIQIYNAPTLD